MNKFWIKDTVEKLKHMSTYLQNLDRGVVDIAEIKDIVELVEADQHEAAVRRFEVNVPKNVRNCCKNAYRQKIYTHKQKSNVADKSISDFTTQQLLAELTSRSKQKYKIKLTDEEKLVAWENLVINITVKEFLVRARSSIYADNICKMLRALDVPSPSGRSFYRSHYSKIEQYLNGGMTEYEMERSEVKHCEKCNEETDHVEFYGAQRGYECIVCHNERY